MLSLLTTLSISFNNPHLNIIPNSNRIGYNICKTQDFTKIYSLEYDLIKSVLDKKSYLLPKKLIEDFKYIINQYK